MDRSHLQHRIPFERNFRWRGGEVSRIEAFTDAVFAVSLTLLVVTADAPTSYAELIGTMKAMPGFAFGFVILVMAWYFHFIHFRRYGLEDAPTMFLNIALLFVLLVYVYPLRFMFGFLQELFINGVDSASAMYGLSQSAVGDMLAIYGVGFVLTYAILGLMGLHALRLRDELELNEVEVVMTRSLLNVYWIQVAIGTLSVALALALPAPYRGLAGPVYLALPILHPLHGWIAARQEKAALGRMEEEGDRDGARVDQGPIDHAPVAGGFAGDDAHEKDEDAAVVCERTTEASES